ncbi:MAG: SsrA-binding protein SmpB [Bacilli bacterium]|nr:SsrA-binding protein SmpB [Bacillales bacterium]MDY2574539.1 SsrA-binding protein SmpB [Bacilli bacterium]
MEGVKIIATNRRASYDYFLSSFLEAGISLKGTEIKSLKVNGASLNDSYVIIKNQEAFLLNMHIAVLKEGNIFNHDPLRTRKLLLHKKEILKLSQKIKEKGYTLVCTKVYLKKGRAKVEIALAKGKKLFDKRESEKEKSQKREIEKMRG